MHQSEALVYGRTKPDRQITEINVCGIDFAPEWQPIHDVDAATVARLAADVDIEVSLQYPGAIPFVMEKLLAAEVLLSYIPAFEMAFRDINLALAAVLFDISKTGVLEKEIKAVKERWTQTGVVSISQAFSRDVIRTHASVPVMLPVAVIGTDYQVHFEVLSAAPTEDFVGEIRALSKSTNGFVVAMTGSATTASLRWTITHFNEK